MNKYTQEGGRLIVEYLGGNYLGKEKMGGHEYDMYDIPAYFPIKLSEPDEFGMKRVGYLEFHERWDWLMIIVDDIKYSRRFPVVVWNEISHPTYKLYRSIETAILNISIKQTFDAVVELIDYHNSQKSKQ